MIDLALNGPQATITLSRPEKHNALERDDMQAFITALNSVATTPTLRVLTITGQGEKTFCAGASLQQLDPENVDINIFEQLTQTLATMPIPVICALNGSVYGGGVELALCCDFRIGIEGIQMFVPAARFGLCYPLAGLRRFVTRLGVGPAKRILIGGETLNAAEMYRVGFLDYLVKAGDFEAYQTKLQTQIIAQAPLAMNTMKKLIDQIANSTFDEDEAAILFKQCITSQDLQEGLLAQAEKRKPVFKGH